VNEQFEKVKRHLSKNRWVYIGTGSGVITGLLVAKALPKMTVVYGHQFQMFAWKSSQTVEVFIEALGDPGNIVQDVTTGTVYASQGQAARALHVSPARISENLAGKLPDVKGHIFKKIGKAVVAE
jgi:hypothetical protein